MSIDLVDKNKKEHTNQFKTLLCTLMEISVRRLFVQFHLFISLEKQKDNMWYVDYALSNIFFSYLEFWQVQNK